MSQPWSVDRQAPTFIRGNKAGSFFQGTMRDKHGLPIRYCDREKVHFGFQTGDIVKAVVEKGKKIGEYFGRMAARASGSFNISTKKGLVEGISYKCCKAIHRKDGYGYQ